MVVMIVHTHSGLVATAVLYRVQPIGKRRRFSSSSIRLNKHLQLTDKGTSNIIHEFDYDISFG